MTVDVSKIVDNIVTHYSSSNFSWTSNKGGTASFQGVFRGAVWTHAMGSPFLCVLESPSIGTSMNTRDVLFNHTIELHICANYSLANEDDTVNDSVQIEESERSISEAFHKGIKLDLVKYETMRELMNGAGEGTHHFNFEIVRGDIPALNLYRLIVRMRVLDSVPRR
jgi:hypothetical protein